MTAPGGVTNPTDRKTPSPVSPANWFDASTPGETKLGCKDLNLD